MKIGIDLEERTNTNAENFQMSKTRDTFGLNVRYAARSISVQNAHFGVFYST